MNINSLKHEVELLHKTLNIDQAVPDWKRQSDKVNDLLKGYEQLSLEEKQRQNTEVLEWYKGVVSQNI